MDARGYVVDHRLVSLGTRSESYRETPVGVNAYDSADGYAAAFVLALHEAYRASPARQRLAAYGSGLRKAVSVLRRLQDPADGLLWNLPPSADRPGDDRPRVKLLMDAAEAYAALRAAASLAVVLSDRDLQVAASSAADALKSGVAVLWDGAATAYAWAKHEDGTLTTSDWRVWYPDAVAQTWTVAVGGSLSPDDPLVGAARSTTLVSKFTTFWPEWSDPGYAPPASGDRSAGTQSGRLEYHPLLGAAFAMTVPSRAREGLTGVEAIDAYAVSHDRPWPFTIGNAGQIALLLDGSLRRGS